MASSSRMFCGVSSTTKTFGLTWELTPPTDPRRSNALIGEPLHPYRLLQVPVHPRQPDVHEDHVGHMLLRGHPSRPSGRVNRNVLPVPGSLSTHRRPPCSSMNCRESVSPSPVPSRLPGEEPRACWNSSKIRSRS